MGYLTALKIKTLPPGKHEDGDGLRLVVGRSGSKRWVIRITVYGQRREMGLGGFPAVTLRQARTKAAKVRETVAMGKDPFTVRDEDAGPSPTFATCAQQYISDHRAGWSSTKHAAQWATTIATYVAPVIGSIQVDRITTNHVLKILRPIWTSKTVTAQRVQGRIENIIDYATAMRWRSGDNPARWRGHLSQILPNPKSVRSVRHRPAMPFAEIPAFAVELRALDSMAARGLEWLILTAGRSQETIGALWGEVDMAAGVWTVPPDRMKGRREHAVPITRPMRKILQRLARVAGNPYLFPGRIEGQSIGEKSLSETMLRLGFGEGGRRGDYVVHGFRSSFRDWASETTPFPRDVCEMALAHTIESRVEAAYRRGGLFEKRRLLMQAWGEWVDGDIGAND